MMPHGPEPHLRPSPIWRPHKLWQLHSAIVRQACEEADVEVLPRPGPALVDGGDLRPQFYLQPCHANRALVFRPLGSGA